ncbi:phosphatidylinositol-binding clathrin assembly protein, putative [Schistosoma mansoni]|uniref:phosphatidylinositol-binding clathrin assembly protein, putative n=1 Tax=Schistosoma mansoni TaxID=6183 RepID=UPI00022C871C|nr:phosphatidylinositol-binding clathrin assembly protein, putative [Schistosoma mansoni]|eukprot:XP_018647361.1 phosphatidylinositol-binding clathrin assembly protein, putative [Schistosoma mansoni]
MAGKVVKQLAGSGTGQSLSDLVTAMKYTLSGSVVVKVIAKLQQKKCALLKENICPVPDFANQIVIRTQHSNLVVVFKALLTIHHLMQFGNERFSQYIASNNCHFYVPSLHDRNSIQAHGISVFLRPYAKYLDEKAASYREVAFDFCRLKRGKEDGDMRTMPQDKLMKTLPVIEKQLDALLMFDATLNELSNSLLRVAHLSLYRDLIRLYAVYNEGMINLIGRYFTMSKRDCRVSLEIYKNFLKRMESMNTFVKVAESAEPGGTPLSIDSENNPFKPVPPSVLEALEEHLTYLEGHKQAEKKITSNISPKSQSTTNPSISNNNNNNNSLRTDDFESNYSTGSEKFILTAVERQRIIEEERARLESFVSTARQHKFSDHQNNSNMNESNQNYYSMKSDNDNFLDLLSFDELSTTDVYNKSNWLSSTMSSPTGQNSTLTSEQNLLDFNDVSTNSSPFGSNRNPPLLLSAQSTSTLVPVMMSPGQLHSTNPFLSNTYPQLSITSKDFTSNQSVSANPISTSPQMQPNSNTVPSKSLISLDDKIAQIAGNLSICDSYSSTQAGRIYRAPDGSLSAINWSGTMPCVQVSTVSNQQMSRVSNIHQSPSLNQIIGQVSINHQPTASIPFNSTNPWAASAQSTIPYQTQSFLNHSIPLNGIINRSTNNNPFLS